MITVDVWFQGTTPILLNRATKEALMGGGKGTRRNTPKMQEDPRVSCEKRIYRLPGQPGQIAHPGAAFMRMAREAGSSHKATGSRKSLKYLVPAALRMTEELCGFYLHDRKTPVVDFEVDERSGVNPATKGRIMIFRAKLYEWALKTRIVVREDIIAEEIIRQLFIEGAEQIGLGDFRPEKGGPFGIAQMVCWETVSDPKPKTVAQKRNGSIAEAR